MKTLNVIALAGALALAQTALAQDKSVVKRLLQEFKKDPKAFIQKTPYKVGERQREIPISLKIFDRISKNNNKSLIGEDDHFETLLQSNSPLRKLEQIEDQSLLAAKLDTQPWSDDYWPIYKGILGSRYANQDFIGISSWKESLDYILANTPDVIFTGADPKAIEQLSPAEKYDLLTGRFDLTNAMWSEGKPYHDHYEQVETWMGICHGWAIASYMEKRPINKVVVKAFDGVTDIPFYPTDIKALASLLWAKGNRSGMQIGGRCDLEEPTFDDNGRVQEPQCHDTNPATWHLSVVNIIGKEKNSFVMDATYDYQVWNQPIVSYSYSYFNPITQEPVETLAQATVPIESVTEDLFAKYRAAETKKLVGIAMEVTYMVETSPVQTEMDSPDQDRLSGVYYLYDLELDEDNNLIGGEWYNNAHPDFLWTAPKEARALSIGDYYLQGEELWDGSEKLPENWLMPAALSSQQGQPLERIVKSLINLSQNKESK